MSVFFRLVFVLGVMVHGCNIAAMNLSNSPVTFEVHAASGFIHRKEVVSLFVESFVRDYLRALRSTKLVSKKLIKACSDSLAVENKKIEDIPGLENIKSSSVTAGYLARLGLAAKGIGKDPNLWKDELTTLVTQAINEELDEAVLGKIDGKADEAEIPEEKRQKIITAHKDGKIVAATTFCREDDPENPDTKSSCTYIFFVAQEDESQRIGDAIVKEIMRRNPESRAFFVIARLFNIEAQTFYKKLCFTFYPPYMQARDRREEYIGMRRLGVSESTSAQDGSV